MALNAFYGTLTCYSTSYCDSVRDIAITKRSISFVCLQRNNKWVSTLLLSLFLRSALLGVLSFMTNGEVKRYRDLWIERKMTTRRTRMLLLVLMMMGLKRKIKCWRIEEKRIRSVLWKKSDVVGMWSRGISGYWKGVMVY